MYAAVTALQAHPVAFYNPLALLMIVSIGQVLSCSRSHTQGQANEASVRGCPVPYGSPCVNQALPYAGDPAEVITDQVVCYSHCSTQE